MFFRWDTTSGEIYGRGPGMIALPDSLTLQAVGETLLESGQRAADPPLFVPDDGAFNAANTFPGGLTYYDVELAKALGRIPVAPMDVGTNLPIGRDIQRDLREQVFAAFFRNVLNLPVDGPQMTATEVIERKEEFIREVGAVFGRLESDYTAPLVERTFAILLRAGAFGPIPESLQGQAIRFRYASPVKRVRQEVEAAAIRLTLEEALLLSQARPEILDNFDVDAIARFWIEARNLPDGIAVDREQVEAMRGQRQQQTQAMQMADLVERGAGVTLFSRTRALDADAAAIVAALTGTKPDPGYGDAERTRDYRAALLGTDQGRRVLADLLERLGMFRDAFDADPLKMARAVARQDVARQILGLLKAEPQDRPTRANSKGPR